MSLPAHARSMAALLALCLSLAGCGTPGVPLPPSLRLPDRVTDLGAVRTGNQVALTWTMPKRTTDKVALRDPIAVRICRRESGSACQPLPVELHFNPGADASFTDTLTAAAASGSPRPLEYFVELRNTRGRTAGLSNAAPLLAGQAPEPVSGLHAEPHKQGIALGWTASAPEPAGVAVRLHRHLLPSTAAKEKKHDLLAPEPEPADRTLLVEDRSRPGHALDRTARLGQSYEYRAQRVARIPVEGKTVELAGPLSEPIRVTAEDIFPPTVPTGLDAVASLSEDGSTAAVDLNWQPSGEASVAGYAVYRAGQNQAWRRISPAAPVPTPAFRDAQVQAGHSYRYAVTAIGQNGRESARSAEAAETVPEP